MSSIYSHILVADSYSEYVNQKGRILCFGTGSNKVISIVNNRNIEIIGGIVPSVLGMSNSISQKFGKKDFENTAYFEPFYLKEFIAGKPKRSLLIPE